jgi:hypothetical protein
MMAVVRENVPYIRILVDAGADANIEDQVCAEKLITSRIKL